VWWNGAALDSLLDERHAALVERALQAVQSYGWRTEVEVSFSVYGERGSIDILGGRERTRSAFVGEVKASIGSIEDMNRRLDVKARHASDLTEERFGWRPQWVSRILIVPDESTMRRIVARHELTLSSAYPVRGRDVRGWLRAPVGSIRGLWFLSQGRHRASVLR
jgi:hypothetical protein